EVNNVPVIWIKVSIDSIHDNLSPGYISSTGSNNNLFLEASTVVERYYVLNYTGIPSLSYFAPSITNHTDSNEVQVCWRFLAGAEQFQLEWTYVNNYDTTGSTTYPADSLQYDFTHNSTRITTTGHSYKIPLIFDKGWLLFRMRVVGKAYDSSDGKWKYVYGRWSSDLSSGDADTVANYTTTYRYQITSPHEKNKNWQYVGTFAEEGKKKEVVSYYDGTLRNRQTVTKTSTDKKVLVGETFYDFQGRAAVTALPAPVPGVDQELKFYDGYNLVDSSSVNKTYSRYDFDKDASACTSVTMGMKTSSGASNYYSASNSEITFQQDFLPDAKKFPFAQVEYMPDNTGRIRQQGGVGPDHQLSSNHQTHYFYAQPFQEELDRLFGTDAGYKKHYNKTVTIDANGQASVTYLDQEGRTIATALAGKNPYNLLPLVNASGDTLYKTSATSFTVDLLGKDTVAAVDTDHDDNILSTDGTKLSVNTQLVVPFAQTYSFAYSITGSQFSPACLPAGVCYQCVYDMTILVRNQ
ncbi:MAG TPA: hypothetical protein VFJ43_01090, partial [Bacteroidia bacterium]|nr:hypothetical protein [Bacteroidia bacterium]